MNTTRSIDLDAYRAAASMDAAYCLELELPVGAIISGMRHLGGGRFEVPMARGAKVIPIFEGTTDEPVESAARRVDANFVRRPKRPCNREIWMTHIMEDGRDIGYGGASPELIKAVCEAFGAHVSEPGPWNDPGPKDAGWYELEGDDGNVVPQAYWNAEKSVWWPILGHGNFYDRADGSRWRTAGYVVMPPAPSEEGGAA